MTIERPRTLSEEEMNRLLDRIANSGAKLTMVDPRVSAVHNWLLASIGGTVLIVGGWGINSINRLNETMATVVQQNAYHQRINDAQDKRLDIYDDRLRIVERASK